MDFWLTQAIGLVGSVIVVAAVQFDNRRLVLAAQAVACILWVVHYGMLGAVTAVYTNFICFARSVVFYNNDKKWARSIWWMWLFVAAFVINSALTWEGMRSVLPGIAMSCTTSALWTRNTCRMRALYLCNSPFWLAYDLICGSYSCALIETVALISYIAAIWRLDIRKRGAKQEGQACTR